METSSRRRTALRCAFAVAATVLSLGLGLLLRPGSYETPYLTFYGAVLVSVLFGGFWAGLLSTFLSAVAVQCFFLAPHGTISLTPPNLIRGAYFLLTFGIICWLIDRRKIRAAAEIAKNEADLRRAQALASTGSWRLDVRRNELWWSEETYRIFGIPRNGSLTYETFLAAVHPDDRESVDRRWQSALKGERYDIEHRILIGQEIKWVRETAELEFDKSGRLIGGFGAVQDITERKRGEEALRESESRLRTILETLPLGVWLADSKGNIVFGNPAAQRIWAGAKYVPISDYGVYKGWWYRTGEPIEAEEWALARALLKGETSSNEVVEIECFDGTHKVIHNSGLPVRDVDGNILGALVINEDITETKKAEEALMRAEKLASAGRLAATIAHEINNPLEAVTNLLYILHADPTVSAKQKQLIDLAQDELRRVSHITRTTLGFYRDSSAPVDLDLATVTEDVLRMYERKLAEKQIHVERRLAPGVTAHVNSGELRQVLSNLIANAVDALPAAGRLLVAVEPPPLWGERRHVHVTVADNGTGIGPEHLSRIYDAFYTTKANVGTGLGLWLSKSIVEKHAGTIRVRSREGKGTVFRISLPASDSNPATSLAAGAGASE